MLKYDCTVYPKANIFQCSVISSHKDQSLFAYYFPSFLEVLYSTKFHIFKYVSSPHIFDNHRDYLRHLAYFSQNFSNSYFLQDLSFLEFFY